MGLLSAWSISLDSTFKPMNGKGIEIFQITEEMYAHSRIKITP